MAKLKVDPDFLCRALNLPTVCIVGAQMVDEFGRPTIVLDLEGPDVPNGAESVTAVFTQTCKLEPA